MPDRPAGFFREGGKVKPRHVKKGINEADLSIKEKGAGEKIEVKIDPEKKSVKSQDNIRHHSENNDSHVRVLDIQDVIDLAVENGSHFFDAGAMKFFKSQLTDKAYEYDDKIYFLTSEQGPNNIRKWSIRYIMDSGNIDTLGEFQKYDSLSDAKQALMHYLEEQ